MPSSCASASAPSVSSSSSRSPRCGGQADSEVRLSRLGAHRREVRHRGRQAAVAEVPHRGRRQPEVDALDERVDRRDRQSPRSGPPPHRRRRHHHAIPARAAAAAECASRICSISSHSAVALRSQGDGDHQHVGAQRERRGEQPPVRPSAASGISQIAYQGTSQAVASSRRASPIRPAGSSAPGLAAGPRMQEQKDEHRPRSRPRTRHA